MELIMVYEILFSKPLNYQEYYLHMTYVSSL